MRLWDVTTGRHLRTLTGHTSSGKSVSFGPDGQTLASGEWDEVRLWDVSTGSHLRTLTLTGHTGIIESVSFSPDGQTLASGSWLEVRLWDVTTGSHLRTLTGRPSPVRSVSFSPDGQTLASGGWEVRLWDVNTGRHLRTFTGHTGIESVSFSPDGQTLASGGLEVCLWDVNTGRHLHTFTGHTGIIKSVSFSPDGQTLASGSTDKKVHLWDVNTGSHVRTLTGHTGLVESVSFSPDGQVLASGSADNTVCLWDVNTGRHLRTFTGHTGFVWSVSFSPDGQTLASGSGAGGIGDGTILLWDLAPASTSNTVISLSPASEAPHNIGDQLTFSLNITDGQNIAGYRVTVSYDITALRYVESANGDYLPAADADFVPPVIEGNKVTLSAISPGHESQGDGTLATLTFEVVANKSLTLKLFDVSVVNSVGVRSFPQVENTEVELIEDARAVEPDGKHYTKWGWIKTTSIFQNFPNPFNPETWIPYQLAKSADVSISIYAADGQLIRKLDLGHQPVGIYKHRSRAAHWDGKNALGEPVVSGVYFYTLTTGEFTATRKMLIRK